MESVEPGIMRRSGGGGGEGGSTIIGGDSGVGSRGFNFNTNIFLCTITDVQS